MIGWLAFTAIADPPEGCTAKADGSLSCADADVSGALWMASLLASMPGMVAAGPPTIDFGDATEVSSGEASLVFGDEARTVTRKVLDTAGGERRTAFLWAPTEGGWAACLTSSATPDARCATLLDAFWHTAPRTPPGAPMGPAGCRPGGEHAFVCPDGSWAD